MLKHLLYTVSLLLAIGICGCTIELVPPPQIQTNRNTTQMPQVVCWSSNIRNAEVFWLAEGLKRFNNPVIFICHGGYNAVVKQAVDVGVIVDLEWWCYPDKPREPMPVQNAADMLANLYPDRDIILVVCNELGHDIKTKRVFYAKQKVWVVPDDYVVGIFKHETNRYFDTTGSIWEFISYDGRELFNAPIKERLIFTTTPATQPTTVPATLPTTSPSGR